MSALFGVVGLVTPLRKMAACGRVLRLLVVLFISGSICSARAVKPAPGDGDNPADISERARNPAGEARAADGAPAGRRSGGSGWRLAEEEACREDVSRICPKHSWNNNLAVLECLQDRKDVRTCFYTQRPRFKPQITHHHRSNSALQQHTSGPAASPCVSATLTSYRSYKVCRYGR